MTTENLWRCKYCDYTGYIEIDKVVVYRTEMFKHIMESHQVAKFDLIETLNKHVVFDK